MLEFNAGITLGSLPIDAQFRVAAGEVTALFGASGSGKSTLLALVAGALAPSRGRVLLRGELVSDAATGQHLPLEERGIGWVFQDGRLFPHLRVQENLRFGMGRRPADTTGCPSICYDDVISVLGLAPLLQRWPRQLSGGERQRVAIGRALLSQPRLLLLDEPLASLDAPRRTEILDLLERLRDDFRIPMLYVTHSLGEVLRLADRLVLLEHGRMLAEGPLQALIGRADTQLLASRSDTGALITAAVLRHQDTQRSTLLDLGDGITLTVPQLRTSIGARVRAYIQANEVILASAPPQAISVRNVLRATINRVQERADGSVLVELQIGTHGLLAAITRDAAQALALARGGEVYALIKSVGIDAPAGARMIAVA